MKFNVRMMQFMGKTIRIRSYSSYTKIRDISEQLVGSPIQIKGWIKAQRVMKNVIFVDVNDGSTSRNLQTIIKNEQMKPGYASSVCAKGVLSQTPKGQLELIADDFQVINKCDIDKFPFQPRTSYPPEVIREHLHLRSRVSGFSSVLRVRHHASASFHNYFNRTGYSQIHTPILSSNDCEGAGEIFTVKPDSLALCKEMAKEGVSLDESYFDRKVFLNVSGQLHLEAMCHGLGDVYTFGPVFRSENSRSPIHLAEFYMIEAEKCFVDSIDEVMRTIEDMMKAVTRDVLDKCEEDVVNASPNRCRGDYSWLDKPFPAVSYAEAIDVMDRHADKIQSKVKFDNGINKEQELFLVKHFGAPVFIVDWPRALKPFYMKQNQQNPNNVDALDFLAPSVGELVGGGVRENDYDRLSSSVSQEISWYLDLRKFGGVPTAGFGLGFERYLQFLLSIHNIKDVIPFPRWAHHCDM
ncbi:probable asparagine--tRNA ligase, mitochondrial [Bradysia coprophila]|uniref:probable asparagine--tRNA ligase, mitochondrial n=1 Tax=Bradysia coprophila TaxID=38358 RepID=UPI00187D72FE|nr:probable asparagine--tRNA ligase, mitochondrial [Bradysia coprophila]